MIFQVPYWDLNGVWPRVTPMLEKALKRQTEWTLPSLLDVLQRQGMQLWIAGTPTEWTGAIVTQIQTFPGTRICMLVLGGGERLEETKHQISEIEKWAKSLGCTEMRISGRPGWQKIYPDYKPITITMSKTL